MMLASGLVTSFALLTAMRPDPWYDPRYAIPLLGMILGNCMTGIALGLDTLTSGAATRRSAIEARLMLGGTRFEAMQPVTREALRRALPAHHQLNVGDRGCVAPRNDDRANSRWRRACGGG